MAVSQQVFPPRKRRPSAGSFISPNFTDFKLIQSLLHLSNEIASLSPLKSLMKLNSVSILRKLKLLKMVFEELSGNHERLCFHPSAHLCLEEMYITLQRIKTLIEDCLNGSKMWLLMQNESVAYSFHELTLNISTLLDVFPVKDVDLNEDVKELVDLIRKQCTETKVIVDRIDVDLKKEVLFMLDQIKREIVPDHLKLFEIFEKLGLSDSSSCRDEIESLEDEFQYQNDQKSKAEAISLIGLVRYAKCVLFEDSAPPANNCVKRLRSLSEMNVPADFRCPFTLDLMKDPVVVATGQTYDRSSIKFWIESGHNTCPKTGQTLPHTQLISNCALKNLIALWCREQKIPFETMDSNERHNGVVANKTASEATKMTVIFLVNKLTSSQSSETANYIIHELRVLAKTDSDSRAYIAEAGGIPLLLRHLGSDNPSLQVNAVTAILNLSILEANKSRIMEIEGALHGVVDVLRSGATWEAKGNAAATIFSLSGMNVYKKRLGRKTRVIKGLVELAKNGPRCTKRDALLAMLNLAGDREAVGKLVESGMMEMVREVITSLPEEAAMVTEVVIKRGGLVAVIAAYSLIEKLGPLLQNGSDRSKESAAATLVTMCRRGGSEMVSELASISGIEKTIWELMGTGTVRARRKAGSLMRILRRWATGLDDNSTTVAYSTTMSSSTIVLPN